MGQSGIVQEKEVHAAAQLLNTLVVVIVVKPTVAAGEFEAFAQHQAALRNPPRLINARRFVAADMHFIHQAQSAEAERHGDEVPVSTQGDLLVSVRPQNLKRCIVNLLDNARQYATNASVAARRLEDAIEITVDDDGPGIPEHERETVFRPFYRMESSRNPGTGGVGLGLAIVRDTIRGLGGDVTLGDSEDGGLCVTVRLPV